MERAKTVLWVFVIVNGMVGPGIYRMGYENVPYILGPPRVLGMAFVGLVLASIYLYEWRQLRWSCQ